MALCISCTDYIYSPSWWKWSATICRTEHSESRSKLRANSDPHNIPAGFLQKSTLGPLLCNLRLGYSSAARKWSFVVVRRWYLSSAVQSGRFVEGLTSRLQRNLNVLSDYLTIWKICNNAVKTQVIRFPHSKSPRLFFSAEECKITQDVSTVDWSYEADYVGWTLDTSLSSDSRLTKPLPNVSSWWSCLTHSSTASQFCCCRTKVTNSGTMCFLEYFSNSQNATKCTVLYLGMCSCPRFQRYTSGVQENDQLKCVDDVLMSPLTMWRSKCSRRSCMAIVHPTEAGSLKLVQDAQNDSTTLRS